MIPYYMMFLAAAFPAFMGHSSQNIQSDAGLRFYWKFLKWLLIILIGFRKEVGGDWSTYMEYAERGYYLSYFDILSLGDPGYIFLNVLAADLGLGMTGINTICALIFVFGLFAFLERLPRPWLGLASAIPYLVIVVGMGYTRQAVALGFVFFGLNALENTKFRRFALWVMLGATFHKTAVLLLPLGALISTRRRIQRFGLVALASYVSYELFLADHTERLYDTYIANKAMQSEGALIRLTMNALPGMAFIWLSKNFTITKSEQIFWKYISWLSVLMVVLLFTFGFSTALDRMALYLIPLQLWVFSHLPNAMRGNMIHIGILFYYLAVQTVWLLFAAHSKYWLPYQIGIS